MHRIAGHVQSRSDGNGIHRRVLTDQRLYRSFRLNHTGIKKFQSNLLSPSFRIDNMLSRPKSASYLLYLFTRLTYLAF